LSARRLNGASDIIMGSDGKQLEGLVSFVEKTLLPQGFDVKTNERVYNDEGIQIAEFDIEIRGNVGSTNIAWLIECRDRPGSGPTPGSWIEQLVGRRTRFGFNKITAVSTTGFSTGATEFAQKEGIELREVKTLSAEEFANWLVMSHFRFITRVTKLNHALILINKKESEDRRAALIKLISSLQGDSKFLRSSKNEDLVSSAAAFLGAVSEAGNLFDDLKPNGPGKKVKLEAHYTDKDYFVVDTTSGPIRVEAIVFLGELFIREKLAPLIYTAEYRRTETGESVSQIASFEPQTIHGMAMALEMHRISETGETHVILRKLPNDH
jgi:hypothetical protein